MRLTFPFLLVFFSLHVVIGAPPAPPVHGGSSTSIRGPLAATLDGGLARERGGGSIADVNFNRLMTVVQLANATSELSRLSSLYQSTEMMFKLEQSRDITVLMPTNKAFESFPYDFERLPYEVTVRILQLHILPGTIRTSELAPGDQKFESIEGTPVGIHVPAAASQTGNQPPRNGSRRPGRTSPAILFYVATEDDSSDSPLNMGKTAVVTSDGFGIDTMNGIAYIVNRVLVPHDLDLAAYPRREGLPQDVPHNETLKTPSYILETNAHHKKYERPPLGVAAFSSPSLSDSTPRPVEHHRGPVVGVLSSSNHGAPDAHHGIGHHLGPLLGGPSTSSSALQRFRSTEEHLRPRPLAEAVEAAPLISGMGTAVHDSEEHHNAHRLFNLGGSSRRAGSGLFNQASSLKLGNGRGGGEPEAHGGLLPVVDGTEKPQDLVVNIGGEGGGEEDTHGLRRGNRRRGRLGGV